MATFILVISNIIILIIGYLIIDYRLKKRYINEDILKKISADISNLISQMNDVTNRNVELVTEKRDELSKSIADKEKLVSEMLLSIEKKIRIIDDKIKQLKQLTPQQWLAANDIPSRPINTITNEETQAKSAYSYIDIINKSHAAAAAKQQIEDTEQKKQDELKDKLSKMDVSEQVEYLSSIGKTNSEIKKMLGISDGEIELTLSLYKTRRS